MVLEASYTQKGWGKDIWFLMLWEFHRFTHRKEEITDLRWDGFVEALNTSGRISRGGPGMSLVPLWEYACDRVWTDAGSTVPVGKRLRSAEPPPRTRLEALRLQHGARAPSRRWPWLRAAAISCGRGVRRGEVSRGQGGARPSRLRSIAPLAPLRTRGEARAQRGDHLPGVPFLRTRSGPGVPRVAVRAGARAVARGAAAAGGGGGSAAQARWCRGDSRARVLLCRRRRSRRFSQVVPAGGGRGAARGERRSPGKRRRAAAARVQVSSERGAGRCGRTRRAPLCGVEGKAGARRGGERWKFDSAGVSPAANGGAGVQRLPLGGHGRGRGRGALAGHPLGPVTHFAPVTTPGRVGSAARLAPRPRTGQGGRGTPRHPPGRAAPDRAELRAAPPPAAPPPPLRGAARPAGAGRTRPASPPHARGRFPRRPRGARVFARRAGGGRCPLGPGASPRRDSSAGPRAPGGGENVPRALPAAGGLELRGCVCTW